MCTETTLCAAVPLLLGDFQLVFFKVFRLQRNTLLLLHWLRLFFLFFSRRIFKLQNHAHFCVYFVQIVNFKTAFNLYKNIMKLLLASYYPLMRFYGIWFPDKGSESTNDYVPFYEWGGRKSSINIVSILDFFQSWHFARIHLENNIDQKLFS